MGQRSLKGWWIPGYGQGKYGEAVQTLTYYIEFHSHWTADPSEQMCPSSRAATALPCTVVQKMLG